MCRARRIALLAVGAVLIALGIGAPAAFGAMLATTTPRATPLDSILPDGTYLADAHDGRLLGARSTNKSRTSLYELHVGGAPRFVRSMAELGRSTLGTDVRGHAVVVATSCSATCHLTAIDLDTGRAHALRRTTNANFGVMDHGRLTFARESRTLDADKLVELPAGGGAPKVTSSATLALLDKQYAPRGNVEIDEISTHGSAVAVLLRYDTQSNGGSGVLARPGGGRWKLIARSGYGEASGIARVFRGLQLDARGVRSFYDGGDNDAGYIARWSLDGHLRVRIATGPLGVFNEVDSATIDGDYLYTGRSRSLACENAPDPDLACAPKRLGPLGLG